MKILVNFWQTYKNRIIPLLSQDQRARESR
jgi:hypothetical protein